MCVRVPDINVCLCEFMLTMQFCNTTVFYDSKNMLTNIDDL